MLVRYVSGEERCIACKLCEESRNDHQDGGHSRLDEGSAQVLIMMSPPGELPLREVIKVEKIKMNGNFHSPPALERK